MAESSSHVDSDLAPPTNPIKNGKRGAEEDVEPQVYKKQKKMEEQNKATSVNVAETTQDENESMQEDEDDNTSPKKSAPSVNVEPTTQDANEPMQEDEDDNTSPKKSAPTVNVEATTQDASESMQEDEDNNTSPKKSVEAAPVAATTQDDAERSSISNEYEEDHRHLETPETSPLKPNSESHDHPATEHHDLGSKTLFLGNLSFLIEEDDVRDFFKNVGEIADLRFGIKDDRFLGYGHIEFTTAEAAQEALKLNREVLLDRRVTVVNSRRERGAYTPGNSMDKSKQRGGHAQVKTVYVRGFEYNDSFDNIRSALEMHFRKCGDIVRLDIPKDYQTGAPRGVAFIEFRDSNGFREALGLDGSEVGGRRLIVEEARKQKGDGREGSGGWSGTYVRESGSGRGWSGSNVRDSGSGGGWSSSNVAKNVSGGGWSGSNATKSGSGGGWSGSNVRESGSGRDTYVRESGSGGGSYARESGSGRDTYARENGPRHGTYVREDGFGRGSYRETWSSAGSYVRESGSSGGGGWSGSHVRESGSSGGGGWSGYSRESGSGGSWSGSHARESGSGRGSYVRERGSSGGSYVRESGGSYVRESGYGSKWRGESGYGSSSSWRRDSSGAHDGGWGRGSGSSGGRFSSRGSSYRVGNFYSGSRRGGRP